MSDFATALAHFQRGDLAAAETALIALLAKQPSHADALHMHAGILHARGDLNGAAALFERAAALSPDNVAITFNSGAVFAALGRHAEAADAFARVLKKNPRDPQAHFARGVSLAALARYPEALDSYDAAAREGLSDAALHANRGAALAALSRHEEAIDASDHALKIAPSDAGAWFNRGASLLALENNAAALAALDRAVALAPGHVVAHATRATALANVGRFDEALAEADFAIARQPERIDHWGRRGHALNMANRHDEALAAYRRVLAQKPDDSDAQFAAADILLSAGDFARGFQLYEARWSGPNPPRRLASDAPAWQGEPLAGKSIAVHTEQGYGDLFQFCRFTPRLAALGARVVLHERPATLSLLKSLAGVDAIVRAGDPGPPTDYRVPMASLMRLLRIQLSDLPGPIPYLGVESERVTRWREMLGPGRRHRIGVCWSGGGKPAQQLMRRLDDQSLDRLLDADVEFVSLQFEAGAQANLLQNHGVRDFGRATADFADLAALIETLDLVVTVDTGVAHLAGALGKPVWIMLPFRADWRWMRDRADSPWYPTARLFRQRSFGEWAPVIDDVLAALQ